MNRRLNIYLFLTLALCLFVTKASAYNVVDEIVGFMLDKRQNNSTTSSTTTTAISTTTTTTTSTTSSRAPSTTTTTTIPSSTTGSSTTTRSTSTRSSTESTTAAPSTTVTETRTRAFTTVTRTVDGRIETSVGITSETTVFTPNPTGPSSNNNESSGISTGTRNTIIGVVVGVGGAIIIGALIIVAFRLRKKKSHAGGYPEDIAGAGSPSTNASSRPQDAFKATLDQYHKPQGTVNPSANF